MNTPVSFEIAKLLKEKGFDEDCYRTYNNYNGQISPFPLLENMGGEPILNPLDYKWRNSLIHESVVSAPTIAEVVMWLYEKCGIWISVYTMETWPNGNERKQLFDYSLKQMRFGLIDISKKPEEFNSPTEAYSQAIEYTLKNLI